MPTLIASAPASIRSIAASRVAMLPTITRRCSAFYVPEVRSTFSLCPCRVDDDDVDLCRQKLIEPVELADADGGAAEQTPRLSVLSGRSAQALDIPHRDQSLDSLRVDQQQFSRPCSCWG